MLIRFAVNGIYSFGQMEEFNMLPSKSSKRMTSHKYNICGLSILKMAAIYGANGAGKSNLVKSLLVLKEILLKGKLPANNNLGYRLGLNRNEVIQQLAIEFIEDDIPYIYSLEFKDGVILSEDLYRSGLGKIDKFIFERKEINGETQLTFSEELEKDAKIEALKGVLEESLLEQNKSALSFMAGLKKVPLDDLTKVIAWFNRLILISPSSKPKSLAHNVDVDAGFKSYAEGIMCSFHVGIIQLRTEKKLIHDYFGSELPKNISEATKRKDVKMINITNSSGVELDMVKEGDDFMVKELLLSHENVKNEPVDFSLNEESDGTRRMLELIPAFKDAVDHKAVVVVDEIERSMHPLLIKELIKKFSEDDDTSGQLIFTTHESQLLDQKIFRADEIWFAEKNQGSTKLYSLSKFKEHSSIDIRKGYLNGRYGSIPFLGNLKDLNWH
ncbi:MAG: ATP-binding protein [Mariprofundaceae bacterium]|nr:ATP-binding protein [Mariprofundaceae bacterium]